jgi:hypothetical protein
LGYMWQNPRQTESLIFYCEMKLVWGERRICNLPYKKQVWLRGLWRGFRKCEGWRQDWTKEVVPCVGRRNGEKKDANRILFERSYTKRCMYQVLISKWLNINADVAYNWTVIRTNRKFTACENCWTSLDINGTIL